MPTIDSFNPRARVGRDPAMSQVLKVVQCFNPRARVGRDQTLGKELMSSRLVSIHAPAWGATLSRVVFKRLGIVSIHAPAWGATFVNPLGMTLP